MKKTPEEFDELRNRQVQAQLSGFWLHRRGKVFAAPREAWGMSGGDGQKLHYDGLNGLNVLNEALGD